MRRYAEVPALSLVPAPSIYWPGTSTRAPRAEKNLGNAGGGTHLMT